MIDQFISEFASCLELPQGSVTPETKLAEIEKLDSMGRLSVMAMADAKYGVVLDAPTLDDCITVSDLFGRISKAGS